MTGIPVGRLRTLALQGVATAVTALLIGGAAVALGQPLADPAATSTESPTESVTDGATEGVTEEPTESITEGPVEEVTDEPAEKTEESVRTTEDGDDNGHGKAVSRAARGLTPPVGDCRNHGHWVSTVAKGLDSCDDNPRPAHGSVSKASKPDKPAHAAKPAKIGKPAKIKAARVPSAKAKGKRP